MNKQNEKEIIIFDSCWGILFILLLIFIGYKNTHIGLIFLIFIGVSFVIYLENSINNY